MFKLSEKFTIVTFKVTDGDFYALMHTLPEYFKKAPPEDNTFTFNFPREGVERAINGIPNTIEEAHLSNMLGIIIKNIRRLFDRDELINKEDLCLILDNDKEYLIKILRNTPPDDNIGYYEFLDKDIIDDWWNTVLHTRINALIMYLLTKNKSFITSVICSKDGDDFKNIMKENKTNLSSEEWELLVDNLLLS